ncbi:MAG: hypothetical protein ACH346_04375 [Chthoniobacterales bacterium]
MDEQKIHRLIQLKRYESAPPNAVELFIEEFQRRQRTELLQPSLLEIIKRRMGLLITEFQVPKIAYVTTTLAGVLVTLFILRSENFNGAGSDFLNSPSSYKTSSALNQDSSPIIIQRAGPLFLNIDTADRDDDSVVFPLSYSLEKKYSRKSSPLIF